MSTQFICKICGCADSQVTYQGPIRLGRFGNVSTEHYQLRQCQSCGVISLPKIVENTAAYYESEVYRQEVDAGAAVADYYRLHDAEQLRHLSITGTAAFRDKIITDIGCGAGSFLDSIRGYTKLAIAIEPSATFRAALAERGYTTYPYTEDAVRDYGGQVDLAVSFSVLEHVEDPLSFLKQIRCLLVSGAKLILSTPNANDVLLQALPENYPQFFYRKAHLWYFTATALTNLLHLAGYQHIKIIPYHRFGLGNFLSWIKDKKPQGDLQVDFITSTMSTVWRTELERTMYCDYLFAEAVHS